MGEMTIDVVVLAGGKNSAEMQAATGVENRALTPLGGRTMLEYVTTALRQSPSVGSIYVVGEVPTSGDYQQVTGGETLLDNLLAGLRAAEAGGSKGQSAERVLVSTSDIPFLTPEGVEDFVQRSMAGGADLCCPFVSLALCQSRFPEMKRTAIKVREGRFTLGNLMLVNPRFLLAHRDTIQRAYEARKSPMQMARLLGFTLLGRLVLAQTISPSLLTIRALEEAVSRLLGNGCRAVGMETQYPEIGTDVDKPDDVAITRRMLGD